MNALCAGFVMPEPKLSQLPDWSAKPAWLIRYRVGNNPELCTIKLADTGKDDLKSRVQAGFKMPVDIVSIVRTQV